MAEIDWGAARAAALQRCRQAGASVEDAEDCVHEAMLTLMSKEGPSADEIREPGRWLVTVAYRRYLDLVRRRTREQRAAHIAANDVAAPPAVDTRVVAQSEARRLLTSLADLPPVTRQVCAGVVLGHSTSELAANLELSTRSVEGHLARARTWLRRIALIAAAIACIPRKLFLATSASVTATGAIALTVAAVCAVTVPSSLWPSSEPDHPSGAPEPPELAVVDAAPDVTHQQIDHAAPPPFPTTPADRPSATEPVTAAPRPVPKQTDREPSVPLPGVPDPSIEVPDRETLDVELPEVGSIRPEPQRFTTVVKAVQSSALGPTSLDT